MWTSTVAYDMEVDIGCKGGCKPFADRYKLNHKLYQNFLLIDNKVTVTTLKNIKSYDELKNIAVKKTLHWKLLIVSKKGL
tara:strand:- start:1465 stop:1704 length:240 start_codon:yes stop_codon:yes gene_type:complete